MLGALGTLVGLIFSGLLLLGYKNGTERKKGDWSGGGYSMALVAIGMIVMAASANGLNFVLLIFPFVSLPILLGTWWGINEPKL